MTDAGRGHLAMLAFSGLVAGSFALGGLAANHIAPTALTAVRFVLAGAILGAVVVARGQLTGAAFRAPWRYLLLGASMGIYFVLMFTALRTVAPVSVSAVFTLTPLMSGAAGLLMLGQHITGRMLLALGIGALGALWVIFGGSIARILAFDLSPGIIIFAVGCACHAVYTPLVRRLNRGESPLVFSLGAILGAALLVMAYGWRDVLATPWQHLPPIVWITLTYITVFATITSFVLLQYASLRLPSAKVMAYTYLTPVWVLVWEIALGHALPSPVILAGVGPIVVALILLLKDEHPEPGQAVPPPGTARTHPD